MKSAYIALAAAGVLALGVSACSKDRKAEADTGTAKAVVSTDAPAVRRARQPAAATGAAGGDRRLARRSTARPGDHDHGRPPPQEVARPVPAFAEIVGARALSCS